MDGKRIKLVIFDLDETVVHNSIPFREMRDRIMKRIGSEDNPPHLYEYLKSKGEKFLKILEEEELRRAEGAVVDEDLPEIARELHERGIKLAILTRNSRKAAIKALGNHISLFDAILARDDGIAPKPAPDGILYLMKKFSAKPEETIVVGDYDYDIDAGRKAGCITVRVGEGYGDFKIKRLKDLLKIINSHQW